MTRAGGFLAALVPVLGACTACRGDGSPGATDSGAGNGSAAATIETVLDAETSGFSWGRALHVDDRSVYFTGSPEVGEPGVFRIDKATLGPPERIGPPSGGYPPQFTSDANHVYWLAERRALRVDKDTLDLIEIDLGGEYLTMAGDSDWLFATTDSCSRLVLVEKSSRAVRTVEPNPGVQEGGSFHLASNATHVQCGEHDRMHSIDKGSGTTRTIAVTNVDRFGPLVWFGERLYTASDQGGFGRFRLGWWEPAASELEVQLEFTSGPTSALSRDPDGSAFYWLGIGTRASLFRFEEGATTPTELVIDRVFPGESAIDQTHIYWVESMAIVRMPLVR